MQTIRTYTDRLQENVHKLNLLANYFYQIGLDKMQTQLRDIAQQITVDKADIITACMIHDEKGIRQIREEIKDLLDI